MKKTKKSRSEAKNSPSKTALSSAADNDHEFDGDNSSEEDEDGQSQSFANNRQSWFLRRYIRHKEAKERDKKANIDLEMGGTTPKTRKSPRSRFSLRRLFFGNPLLAQPFHRSPATTMIGGPSGSSRRTKGPTPGRSDDQSDTRSSVWRDNLSACSNAAQSSQAGGLRECPLCLAECTLDQYPLLRNCPHLFCIECLHTYVRIEIQEGRANLKCPQCTELMHPNDIASLIGDKNSNLLTLYESLMLRRLLASDPDTRWCPGPNCTYAVIATGCASCPKIECERPGCGSAFCYHCKAEWHANQTCDAARAQRHQQTFRSSSATLSLESAAAAVAGGSTASGTAAGGQHSEVKACPRCQVLAVKMHDGSCNHMTCAVCGVEFCWLCMKEISDLHYLSPSGCTFWGKKPWSRKKKLLWQLGTLVGAPVGIALLAGISIPAMLIGIPSWVGRKIHDHYKGANRHKRNLAVVGGVVSSIILSPFLAGLAVSIGVPILLCYVYGVVPIALCRSEGCGVSTSGTGVKIDIDEDPPYRPSGGISEIVVGGGSLANPSIGEASLGASMSMGSGCILENNADNASREPDRESASITAVAGASLTGSVASSYLGPPGSIYSAMRARHNRLEVGVDVHPRKKFSFSSERLSETVSLSERSATASLADYGGGVSEAASTRALAGSLLAYGLFGDSQSMYSYRAGENTDANSVTNADEVSLRSLPLSHHHNIAAVSVQATQSQSSNRTPAAVGGVPPRSMSPVSSMSGDELSMGVGGRRSQRRRPLLDKQLSENSSLLSAEDTVSERVRFDDNISFIDDSSMGPEEQVINIGGGDNTSLSGRLLKGNKIEPSILTEETAEELAEVISPEPKHRRPEFVIGNTSIIQTSTNQEEEETCDRVIDEAGSSILSQGAGGVTLLSIGHVSSSTALESELNKEDEVEDDDEDKLTESFSAQL